MWKQWAHLATLVAIGTAICVVSPRVASAQSTASDKEKAKEANRIIKVVQPKPVAKRMRFELTPWFAYQPNDDFIRGYVTGANIGFHVAEGLSLEFIGAYAFHTDKQLLGTIRDLNTQPKVLDRMQYMANAGFSWAPIYGKVALLNRYIVHYDFYVSAGAGITGTELEITNDSAGGGGGVGQGSTFLETTSFFNTYIGMGQRYFWKDWAAIRVDVKNYSYVQVVDSGFNIRNNLLIGAGFSFFL